MILHTDIRIFYPSVKGYLPGDPSLLEEAIRKLYTKAMLTLYLKHGKTAPYTSANLRKTKVASLEKQKLLEDVDKRLHDAVMDRNEDYEPKNKELINKLREERISIIKK